MTRDVDYFRKRGIPSREPLPLVGNMQVYFEEVYQINVGYVKKVDIKAVFIPVYSLHHDERYFPDPQKFNQDRFSDENRDSIVPGSFVLFEILCESHLQRNK